MSSEAGGGAAGGGGGGRVSAPEGKDPDGLGPGGAAPERNAVGQEMEGGDAGERTATEARYDILRAR